MRISILEVNINCVFEWKMQNPPTALTDTAANTSKKPTISVIMYSGSLNRRVYAVSSSDGRSYLCPHRTHTWTPHNVPTEWKGGPDGRRHMGLGVVEGTLVKLCEREREREGDNERERSIGEKKKTREIHGRFKRKAKRQFKSGCTS